jgi:hypothetical protein
MILKAKFVGKTFHDLFVVIESMVHRTMMIPCPGPVPISSIVFMIKGKEPVAK